MSNLTDFDQQTALTLLESDEQFPVSFDDAYEWLGYTRKDNALRALKENFVEGEEFSSSMRKTPQGGRPSVIYRLTNECFKMMAMMAGTEMGKQVRLYYLECEKQLKAKIRPESPPPLPAPEERVAKLVDSLEKAKELCGFDPTNPRYAQGIRDTIATTDPTAPGQITNRQHQLNRLEMLAQLLGMLGQQMVTQHHEMGTVLDTAAGELWTVLWELREEEKNAN